MDPKEMGTRELREQLGHRIDAAYFLHEPTVVTRNGERRAVLISYADWTDLRKAAGISPADS